MSVVVIHKDTQEKFVMIGTGYGIMKEENDKYFGQYLLHQDDQKMMHMAAVCDYEGNISWYDTDRLKVVEIDGNKIEALAL